MPEVKRGKLVVVSGPSGAGKGTVLKGVLRCTTTPLVTSVSATTRPARPGEVDGVDYHFLTPVEFAQRRERGEFLECFPVFDGDDWYGTLRGEVEAGLEAGKWVVLEIDVKGASAVTKCFPDAITIFIGPGSLEELERRLRGRKTEDEQSIQRRLRQAREELAMADRYQHHVVNDDLDRAVQEVRDLLTPSKGR